MMRVLRHVVSSFEPGVKFRFESVNELGVEDVFDVIGGPVDVRRRDVGVTDEKELPQSVSAREMTCLRQTGFCQFDDTRMRAEAHQAVALGAPDGSLAGSVRP